MSTTPTAPHPTPPHPANSGNSVVRPSVPPGQATPPTPTAPPTGPAGNKAAVHPHAGPPPKWWHRVISFAVFAAVIYGGYEAYHFLESHDEAPAAAMGGGGAQGPLPVQVVTVSAQALPARLSFIGKTVASQEVEVRGRVAAYLEKRLFEEGSKVQKGEVLFTLERTKFEAALDAAKASKALAEAKLDQATREVERTTASVRQHAATEKELEDWKTQKAMARAEIDTADAAIKQAELDLSYTEVRSPLTGVIGKSAKDPGAYLDTMNPNADSLLATVSQIDPLYVEFAVSERDLIKWQKLTGGELMKQEVQLQLADGSTFANKGTVDFVDTRLDASNGTVKARATVQNPEGHLRPGQFVRVSLLGLQRKGALAVPQQAVIQSPTGASVYVVADGKAQPRQVTLGEWVKDLWIIESGVKEGDEVIVGGLQLLQMMPPGVPVKPMPADAAGAAPAAGAGNVSAASNEKKEGADAR